TGKTCISVIVTCSCQDTPYNACVDTACESGTDCPSGSVCTPPVYIHPETIYQPAIGRCFVPACTSDADCTDGDAGRCAMIVAQPLQSGDIQMVGVRCVYAGATSSTIC